MTGQNMDCYLKRLIRSTVETHIKWLLYLRVYTVFNFICIFLKHYNMDILENYDDYSKFSKNTNFLIFFSVLTKTG